MKNDIEDQSITIIEPPRRWQLVNFKELLQYRDLIYTLAWRDVSVMYSQTVLGFAWAIIQPLMQIIVFSIIFGKVAKIPTDGIPYLLFSTMAIIPWAYMSSALTQSSQSLVAKQGMLGKIYFPRLIFPLTPVLSKLGNYFISMILLVGVMIYY